MPDPKPRTKRLAAVTVVGLVVIVANVTNLAISLALIYGVNGGGGMAGADIPWVWNDTLTDAEENLIASYVILAGSLVSIATGVALIRMRRWAWALQMTLVALALLLQLFRFFDGHPNYISMVINTLVAFALNQQEVQEAFGIRRRRDDSI